MSKPTILRTVCLYALGFIVRFIFLKSSTLTNALGNRVEVSTPITSWKKGVNLWKHGTNPYDSDIFHESPLGLVTYDFILTYFPGWLPVIFAICDVLTAVVLSLVAKIYVNNSMKKEQDEKIPESSEPLLLKSENIAWIDDKKDRTWKVLKVLGTIATFVAVTIQLIFTFRSVTGSWHFLWCTYGCILSVPDLTPNIGLFWYFFTEIFEHFRVFFLCTFQLNVFVYTTPLAVRLRQRFIVCCVLASCTLLAPTLWHLWIYSGSANANFYFAITLAFNTGQVFLLTDILSAYIKREYYLENGVKYNEDGTLLVIMKQIKNSLFERIHFYKKTYCKLYIFFMCVLFFNEINFIANIPFFLTYLILIINHQKNKYNFPQVSYVQLLKNIFLHTSKTLHLQAYFVGGGSIIIN
ncbi:UNVERIFIED_CONTAM: Phosphatidylinositol glycan anchor biosynthesis class U protein [Trichonephila clavipes]